MKTTTFTLILSLVVPATLAAKPKAPPRPVTTSAGTNGVNHVVQRGDTLYSIAEKYYGSGYQYVKLAEYNPWVMERGPEKLNQGEIIFVPDPQRDARVSSDPPNHPFPSIIALSRITLFGRTLIQLVLLMILWFILHFSVQGIFVWFAAHLAFVKDVSMKKAMKATLQAESLALLCLGMAVAAALLLTPDMMEKAEGYLCSPGGIIAGGILLVALYGFLGIRFIPPAFGMSAGRGVAVVLLAILIPHLVGFYLIGHRMGLIN